LAGRNVIVENGDVVTAVNNLKSKPGKDIIVNGGAGFVSLLIDHQLIDELHLFINAVTIGKECAYLKAILHLSCWNLLLIRTE
jgi:dihydrofolate reductase